VHDRAILFKERSAWESGGAPELLFDTQQLIVFRDAISASGQSGYYFSH
jgi:hypothetical protein